MTFNYIDMDGDGTAEYVPSSTNTNGYIGYLTPADGYEGGSYQSTVSPFRPGCLERLTDTCAEQIAQLDRQLPGTVAIEDVTEPSPMEKELR